MKTTRIAFRLLLASAGLGLLLALLTPRATALLGITDSAPPQSITRVPAAAQPPGCISSPFGQVSWWPFEGNTNDFYAANNGVPTGNPAFVTRPVGQALDFDGLNDQVKVTASGSTNVGPGSGFTIEMWINPHDVSSQRPLVEWGNAGSVGVHLWISVPLAGGGPGSLFVNMKNILGGDAFASSAPGLISEGTYHHVALTYRKDGLAGITTLYINGSVVAGPVDLGAFPQTSYDLYFGVRPSSAGSLFVGQMDEIGLFNRELSQAEIQSIHNAGSVGKCKTRYVTNNTDGADPGPDGSLRRAINNSNAYNAPNTIAFNIQSADSVKTITPTSILPIITGPVTIDGTTQPGFAGSPTIELNGALAGNGSPGLWCLASVTIKGLVINRFSSSGIFLDSGSGGSVVIGNYVGTNAVGNLPLGNGLGVAVSGLTASQIISNVRIGGTNAADRNVISGNNLDGIYVALAANNLVQGNYIGTDASGTLDLGNGRAGILVDNVVSANGNHTIGGTSSGERNVISGNGGRGIWFLPSSSGNVVQGNYIGTSVSGLNPIANDSHGIELDSSNNTIGGATAGARNIISANVGVGLELTGGSNIIQGNYIGTDLTGSIDLGNRLMGISVEENSTNNMIGGTAAGTRNVISGNNNHGVVLIGSGNKVQGNFIGTDVNGVQSIANSLSGASVAGSNNLIGGPVQAAGNVISGNLGNGIVIGGTPAMMNVIQGNLIGVDAFGSSPLGNGADGILVIATPINPTRFNLVGLDNSGSGSGNLIAFNGGAGVNILSLPTAIAIRGNSIHSNVGLGIDLTPDAGVTPNDLNDADTGPNDLQNFPVLTSAISAGGSVTIDGTLNSTPGQSFRIEIFSNSSCDGSSHGEGQKYLGFTNVNTNAGTSSFNPPLVVPSAALVGPFITATATDLSGNTSEFSQCVQVSGAPTPTPTPTPNTIQLAAATINSNEGAGSVAINVSRTGNTSGTATVNYASSDTAGLTNCNVVTGIASSRCDYATAVGTLRFDPGQTLKSISIPLIDDSYADGTETFTIVLSNAAGATLGAPSTASVTISDNESSNGPNPIDGNAFFVRQQYIDFLNREPDPAGFAGWLQVVNNCPAGDTTCDRIHVSSAFFRSPEFQDRGYFVYRFYPVSFGRKPDYGEFVPDLAKVSGFLSDVELEAAKVAFIAEFMSRPAFVTRFNGVSNTQYVDTLLATAGITHPARDFWIAALGNGTRTRAQVLREIAESTEVYNKYYNESFVTMQYFGYLRRDPDALYLNWIAHLNSTGDYRSMINGFMNSLEYRFRFGP